MAYKRSCVEYMITRGMLDDPCPNCWRVFSAYAFWLPRDEELEGRILGDCCEDYPCESDHPSEMFELR